MKKSKKRLPSTGAVIVDMSATDEGIKVKKTSKRKVSSVGTTEKSTSESKSKKSKLSSRNKKAVSEAGVIDSGRPISAFRANLRKLKPTEKSVSPKKKKEKSVSPKKKKAMCKSPSPKNKKSGNSPVVDGEVKSPRTKKEEKKQSVKSVSPKNEKIISEKSVVPKLKQKGTVGTAKVKSKKTKRKGENPVSRRVIGNESLQAQKREMRRLAGRREKRRRKKDMQYKTKSFSFNQIEDNLDHEKDGENGHLNEEIIILRDQHNESIQQKSEAEETYSHYDEEGVDRDGDELDSEECVDRIPLVLKTGSDTVLVLWHPNEIRIKGKVHVKCLCGAVSILGYSISNGSTYHNVYSPSSTSLLTFKTIRGEDSKPIISEKIKDELDEDCQKELLTLSLERKIVVLKMKEMESAGLDYISSIPPTMSIFSLFCPFNERTSEEQECNADLSSVGLQIIFGADFPHVEITRDFVSLADMVPTLLDNQAKPPVILVCGGNNTGKSTLNRFLLNTVLNSMNKVYYMECDIGQTEFTPPGCVALHCVEKPIFGPPFCHQREPIYSVYYGGVSPSDNPGFYLKCVKAVYRRYRDIEPHGPLIVNTMGWNKGLGLLLFTDTVRITLPSHVVQLDSFTQHLNFPAITPTFIATQPGWLSNSKISQTKGAETGHPKETHNQHKLILVGSAVQKNQTDKYTKLKSVDHRNLSTLGYLTQKLTPGMTLLSQAPYTVSWDCVAVNVCHSHIPDSQILLALNASVVALCRANMSKIMQDPSVVHQDTDGRLPRILRKTPLCRCLGFGIIRGIDTEKKLFYISTPMSLNTLQQVNTLVRGAINLPEQVLLRQECSSEVPYVSSRSKRRSVGGIVLHRRQHMPRAMKSQQ
ncbi:hypothetical protein ScPMuIL_007842 [Solemya velum]